MSCTESEATVTDCAALGAKCSEQRLSGIVVRACFAPDKCPAGAPEARCDGEGSVITCRDGAIERVACGTGTKCRERTDENGEPSASCVLGGGACMRGCNGDRLVDCVKGRAKITDCGAEGLACEGSGPRAACVVKNVDWSEGGSKRGTGIGGATVFEPRDQQKGDTARALLYFYTVYGRVGSTDTSNFKLEEATLHAWNQADPVDATERQRNDAIFAAQGNRNPFVDHPEWVDKVGNFLAR